MQSHSGRRLVAFAVFACSVISTHHLTAAALTWNPGGDVNSSGTWTTTANAWSGGSWVSGSDAIFYRTSGGSSRIISMATNTGVTAASVTLTNNPGMQNTVINSATGATFTNTSGNYTVNASAGGSGYLDFRTQIIGSGGMTVDGGGTMSISNVANTFTGGVTVKGGSTLILANKDGILGDVANTVSLNNGTLFFSHNSTNSYARDIALQAGGGTFMLRQKHTSSTLTGIISGSGQLTFNDDGLQGSGTVGYIQLNGANTYNGGTIVSFSDNTLAKVVANHNTAFGSGEVKLRNSSWVQINSSVLMENNLTLESATSRITRAVASSGSYNFGTSGAVGSHITSGRDTTAQMLAGTNATAGTQTMEISFSTTSAATNDGIRVSDVFKLDGTGGEIFVLQLSEADVVAGNYLGWLDGSGSWTNAVTGNTGNNATLAQQGFAGAFTGGVGSFQFTYGSTLSNYIGAWGIDASNQAVWAVLNHNSDFAVVPEPQPVALIGIGCIGLMLAALRRRRAQA